MAGGVAPRVGTQTWLADPVKMGLLNTQVPLFPHALILVTSHDLCTSKPTVRDDCAQEESPS